jgi:hypothetical protein
MRSILKILGAMTVLAFFTTEVVGQFDRGNLLLGSSVSAFSEIGDEDISTENFYIPVKSRSLDLEVSPSAKFFVNSNWSWDLTLGIGYTSIKKSAEDLNGNKSESSTTLIAFQGGLGTTRYLEIKESLFYFGISTMLGLSRGNFEASNSDQKQIGTEYFIGARPSLIVFLAPKLVVQASIGNLELNMVRNTLERNNPPGYLPAKESDNTFGFDLDLIPTSMSLNLQYLIR